MGRLAVPFLVAACFLLTFATPANAATPNTWTALGPSAAQVLALAASPAAPAALYAATQDRVWKSADAGQSWTGTSAGPTALAESMVADPADGDAVVAAAANCTAWVSSDGGATWAEPHIGFTGTRYCMPVLAWSPSGLFALARGNVYSSSNGGLNWSIAGSPPDSATARALLVLPTTPATIYVGTEAGKVRLSIDGGATWSVRSSGLPTSLPDFPFPPGVTRLAVDPADHTVLYAEMESAGLYRTTDRGLSWHPVASPVADAALTFPVTLATTPTTLVAVAGTAAYRSTNGGASWLPATRPPGGLGTGIVTGFLPDPSNANAVYASAFGVYRSLDAGVTFDFAGNGLDKATVHSLVPVSGSPGSYLAATEGVGVQRTDDDGDSWQVMNDGIVGQTLQLAAHPTDGNVFFVEAGGHLWKTINGGGHWGLSDIGIPYGASAIAIDPSSPSTVYTGVRETVYRSTDGGVSWTASTLPMATAFTTVHRLAVDPTDGSRVYAGTYAGLYRSSDGGTTWTLLHADYVHDVLVTGDGDVFTAGTYSVRRFGPASSTPVVVWTYPDHFTAFGEDPEDAEVIYAGTQHGVYQSVDGGGRWAKLATTGLDSDFITDISSISHNHLMVGTPKGTARIDLTPPAGSAAPADEITTTSVRFSGSGNPTDSSSTAFFEYGPTASYGSTTPATALGSGGAPVTMTANVTGLSPVTTYHYRLVVESGGGIDVTDDATFTTNTPPPVSSTGSGTLLSSSTARVTGSVTPSGGATSYWFEYGTTTSYGQLTSSTSAGSGLSAVAVQAELTGLAPDTVYHFRLVAQNSGATISGTDRQLTTPSPFPMASTGSGSFVTSDAALLVGRVNANGQATSYWFEYGTTTSYGQLTEPAAAGSGLAEVYLGAQLTGLSPATTYHFRIVAESAGGTSLGADLQFTTLNAIPTTLTGDASSVSSEGALLQGSVNANGSAASYRFDYGRDASYGLVTEWTSAGSGSTPVDVQAELSGLSPATVYHYRLSARTTGGTYYGVRRELTTASVEPTPGNILVPPTMGTVSVPRLRSGRLVGGAVPLALSWSAVAGSGAICTYEVDKGSNGLSPTRVGVVESTALATRAKSAAGLYYRVRALSCDGTPSAFADSAPVRLRLLQESNPALHRSAGWTRRAAADASGGYVLRTATAGARLALSVRTRSLALVLPKGREYGAVSVSIDGTTAIRIDLYRASRAPQMAVYVLNFPSVSEHKVVIRARAAGSRHRVDLDAFSVVS